jgi:hypothetical protein|tara:strand:- start:160 stop:312 length:153 start_codon:yes stop_codon:yes gene_type:complete
MSYEIIGDAKILGQEKGAKITKKDLVEHGANIAALIEGGHIADTKPKKES